MADLSSRQAGRQLITTAARFVFTLPPIYQSQSQLPLKGHGSLGNAPEGWQKATITALFKKGQQQDGRSYRLVSHTSVPRKVVEQVIQ